MSTRCQSNVSASHIIHEVLGKLILINLASIWRPLLLKSCLLSRAPLKAWNGNRRGEMASGINIICSILYNCISNFLKTIQLRGHQIRLALQFTRLDLLHSKERARKVSQEGSSVCTFACIDDDRYLSARKSSELTSLRLSE